MREDTEILIELARGFRPGMSAPELWQRALEAAVALTNAGGGALVSGGHDVAGAGSQLAAWVGPGPRPLDSSGLGSLSNIVQAAAQRGQFRIDDLARVPHVQANFGPVSQAGARSLLVMPIGSGDAALVLFDAEPDRFTQRSEQWAAAIASLAAAWAGTSPPATSGQSPPRVPSDAVLRVSEERFRQLADAMPQLVWIARGDGAVIYYNSRFSQYAGIAQTGEGLEARWEWRPVVHPADLPATLQAWRDAVANGNVYEHEHRICMATGEYRWHLSRAHGIDVDGAQFWFGTATDIHALKEVQQALRASEARYRAIVESQNEMVCRFRPDGFILFANEAYARAFNATPDELEGQTFWQFIDANEHAEIKAQLEQVCPERPLIRIENRIETVAGTRWTLWTNHGLSFDEVGRATEVQSTGIDITERKLAELALRESEARFQNIANAAPAIFWVTEPDLTCSFLSLGWYRLTGQTPETALGIGWLDAVHPDDRSNTERVFRDANRRREPFSLDYRLRRADGVYRWAIDIGRPRFGSDGQFLGFVGSVIDVHERKETEAVVQRTLESERQARADAEQASRLKDEFLATLSHELRTPLNAILGWSRLIERNAADLATVTQGIEVISRNAQVQIDLIADLLDMSRIISGKLRLEVEAVNLSDVVLAAIESVRHAAEAKGVRLQTIISPIADPVRGDASRLQQVVWNLVSNAVKFTPKGGRVQVALSRKNSHAELVVSDTGIGISAEFLPHLFERFRQADASTTRRHGGLGLGLSIVRHLVELHGGTVRATSPGEGQGATFIVQLPLALMHLPPDPASQSDDWTTSEPSQAELAGVRILTVDDQADARELVRRLLEERAAEVIVAESAEEALQAVEMCRPHVVLCDIGMPGKDGYMFIRALRQRGYTTPAIAVTAFARTEDRLRALRAGYQGHVTKPVEPAELIATIAVFTKPPLGEAR